MISLEVVEDDAASDSQVIKWIARFPYPMYARLYVYVRRKISDPSMRQMIILSKALDDSKYPGGLLGDPCKHPSVKDNYVRVTRYKSKMVVRAHAGWNEVGVVNL